MRDRVVKEAGEYVKRDRGKLRPSQILWPAEKQLGTMKCCTAAFCSYFSLFMSLCLYFLFRPLSHSQPRINISPSFHKTLKETYLALVTSRVSVKRKRCLSWICKPVFSCVWAWPRNRRPGHSARKAWTRGQVSGLTGVKQLSLGGTKPRRLRRKEWFTLLIPKGEICGLEYVEACTETTSLETQLDWISLCFAQQLLQNCHRAPE